MTKIIITLLFIFCSYNIFSQDGSLDYSFANNGILSLPGLPNSISNITTDTLSNDIFIYGGNQIVKLDNMGQYDNNFANSGIMTFTDTYYFNINKIIILQNGKMIVVGSKNNNICISRINSNGSIDTSFGTNGFYIYDYGFGIDKAFSVIQNNNKLYIVGYVTNSNFDKDFIILKLTMEGLLDQTFGDNGIIVINYNDDDILRDIIIDTNDNIFACGSTYKSDNYFDNRESFSVIKMNSNGLETNFGDNGVLIIDNFHNEKAFNIDFYNNSIYLSGESRSNEGDFQNLLVIKMSTDGIIDNEFGRKIIFHELGGSFNINKPIKQDNGKFIYGTYLHSPSNETFIRINTNGDFDNSFSDEEYFTNRTNLSSLTKQFNIKFLALGSYPNGLRITRHLMNDNTAQINKNTLDDFEIYPNPTLGKFIIKNPFLHKRTINIYSLEGKLLKRIKPTTDETKIDLNYFNNGVYLIEIISKNKKFKYKLIKNSL